MRVCIVYCEYVYFQDGPLDALFLYNNFYYIYCQTFAFNKTVDLFAQSLHNNFVSSFQFHEGSYVCIKIGMGKVSGVLFQGYPVSRFGPCLFSQRVRYGTR